MLIFLLACGSVADGDSVPDPATCEAATPADIRERKGDYYRCLDTTLAGGAGCGADGYPLGFGARYADQSFDVTWHELGKEGQAFFLAVSPCLQERLAERVTAEATCDEVWDAGFGTHADCYVESGFCDLPLEDLAVIAVMFDAETMALPEFQAAIGEVTARCAKTDRTARSSAAFERATLFASGDGGGRVGTARRPDADDNGASDAEKKRDEPGACARIGETAL